MKNQDELLKEFYSLKTKIENRGCSEKATISFIVNNIDFLLEKKEEINDKIYFLYNHDELYGLIVVDDETYTWSRYENETFQKLREITSTNQETLNEDFVIEMSIRFADSEKVRNIVPEIKDMNIEEKVKTLKKIGLNSKGYHFE